MTASVLAHETNTETSGLSDDNTVSKPTGTADGNLLVSAVGLDGNDGGTNAPSGFTLDYDFVSNTSALASGHKTAGASEPSSYTWDGWNNEPSIAGMLAIEDHDGIDVTNNNTSDATTIGTSITTTADDCLLVVFVSSESGDASWSAPDGTWTELFDLNTTGGNAGTSLACFTKAQASAGASGTLTFTSSEDNNNSIVIYAIAPAAVAANVVKTFNGIAKASIKTYKDIAVASVKTINGISLT